MVPGSTCADPAPWPAGLRADTLAGLTAAAVVLPQAMAYAAVAGLPVAVGLYTALVPMAVYALLGSSRVLSVSTTSTLAILVTTQLAQTVPDGNPAGLLAATATLGLMAGAILLLASALRLGFIANFISRPVLTGFKAGVGLVIVLDQLPRLLGVQPVRHGFFRGLAALVRALPGTSWPTLAVGGGTVLLLVALHRRWPHAPAALLAVAGGIGLSWLCHLPGLGVAVVGAMPRGLPPLTLPHPALLEHLLPGAAGIALMTFTESIAAGRAFADPAEPAINANRELLALGAADLAGAFLGAMPAGGGTSQTAVVRAVGGRSQRASLVTAGAALATMLVLAPLLARMPRATLAAVVLVYSASLIRPGEFNTLRKVRSMEFTWALVAFGWVLVFGTLQGIVVAIVASLIGLAYHAAHPKVYVLGRKPGTDVFRPVGPEHPSDQTFPGLLLLRVEGSMFFLNAEAVGELLRAQLDRHRPRVAVVDLGGVPELEYTALVALMEAEHRAGLAGTELWLADLSPAVLETVRRAGFAERLGRERLLFNAEAAVAQYLRTSNDAPGRT